MTEKEKKVFNVAVIGSGVGLLAGLTYAFKKGKGFWGYVGFGLLGSIAGSTAFGIPARILIKDAPLSGKEGDKSNEGKNTEGTTTNTGDFNFKLAQKYINDLRAKIEERKSIKLTPEGVKDYIAKTQALEQAINKLGYKVIASPTGGITLQKA